MHQQGIQSQRFPGQHCRRFGIHPMRLLRFAFSLVDSGIRRGIDNNVGRKALYGGGEPRQVIQIATVIRAAGVQCEQLT
ncbi:hypothetical protein D9M71_823570 [compost metagenome]